MSVVLTAVLVFAAIGRRDRLDQGNRTQRPRGRKKPRYRQEGAKEGPREAEGKAKGEHGDRRQEGEPRREQPRRDPGRVEGTWRREPVVTSGCLICAACQMFSSSSAIEGVQQISILSSMAEY